MCYILICASTFPLSSAIRDECYRGNLDPQWRQMVAGFLVAVQSAVHRAADCACGENKQTPEALQILTDAVTRDPQRLHPNICPTVLRILIDQIYSLNLYILNPQTPLSYRDIFQNYSPFLLVFCPLLVQKCYEMNSFYVHSVGGCTVAHPCPL